MAHKKITISSTPELERDVSKFIHSQKLKNITINRSELYRNAVRLFMAEEKKKRLPGRGPKSDER